MSQEQRPRQQASVEIQNVGGITQTVAELQPPVTILSGRNATNRTSFLQALMAALGSDNVALKADAEEGSVELTIDGETYSRELRRANGKIVTDGDPYLDDPTRADLFAFLLESNEARRAIVQEDDLREVMMRPVDTAEINRDIKQLTEERQRIEDQLDELGSLERNLPELERQRTDLEEQITEKREDLADLEAEIEAFDTDVDEQREEKAELEATLDDLSSVRSDLESARRKRSSERESIEALETEREEVQDALEEYSEVPQDRIEGITAEVKRLRREVTEIESTVDELQTVIQFNENVLDGDFELFTELSDRGDQGELTDQLIEDEDTLACWTCGHEIETSQIEAMVERLRAILDEKMEERNALTTEIEELQTERNDLQDRKREYERQHSRLDDIDEEIADREARIEELEARKEELTDEVESLEAEVEELRTEDQSELLELHTEANRTEVEIERLEDNREEVTTEIERIEDELSKEDQLVSQREELSSEIEELRTRIERLEEQSIEAFNEQMDTVLEMLNYENLERVWIERSEREVREGRRKVTKGQFELHIVRSMADGTVYEDTIDHLSESEREVTGLVFALAGYLTHEVYEDVPFVVLDSVEALDSTRIARLVEYLGEFADHLVVALLEEDAAALDEEYQRITEI